MCVRLANDLLLFDRLCGKSPQSITELSQATGAENGLVSRLLRSLSGMGFVRQVSATEYTATAVSEQMTKPSVRAGVKYFYDQGLPVLEHVPAYFRANGYRLPCGMTGGPFQFAHNTTEDCYTYWSKQPGVMENFSVFMQGLFGTPSRLSWTDWFPVEEICLDRYDNTKGEYCFVDVGGGKGHEAELILKKYPGSRGRFVVEDLPFVINDIASLDDRVERLPHDFTKEQPIKGMIGWKSKCIPCLSLIDRHQIGARTYFLQNILHNWASDTCHTILVHLREAMIPGYSQLIIANIVVPEENVSLRTSGLDIAMLYLHSGSQRSESEWRQLLEGAGFNVVKVWHPPGDGDGILQAEVAQ